MNVYLDDLRTCPEGFVPARNYDECILLLQEAKIRVLSLDHDLDWGEPTGYDVVRYMVEHQLYADEIYIHSSSIHGKMKMYQLLYENKPEGVKLFNTPMPADVLDRCKNNTE